MTSIILRVLAVIVLGAIAIYNFLSGYGLFREAAVPPKSNVGIPLTREEISRSRREKCTQPFIIAALTTVVAIIILILPSYVRAAGDGKDADVIIETSESETASLITQDLLKPGLDMANAGVGGMVSLLDGASTSDVNSANTKIELDSIIKIDPNSAENLYGEYRMDTMLHLDWQDADWMMQYIATKEYGGKVADDTLALPAFVNYDWVEQAIGTQKVTYSDLEGVDLSDHEAVKKLLDANWATWQKEWKALTPAEKSERTDQAVYLTIVNMEGAAEAWYLAFKSEELVYNAAKEVLDDMDRYFVDDYSIKDKDKKKEGVGRERHLVYPKNPDIFNPSRPELSATLSDEYFEDVSAQLCNIYSKLHSDGFKKIKTDTHWCLPRLTDTALRHVAPATYTDNYESLVKVLYGKGGVAALRFGVNNTDLRPMILKTTVASSGTARTYPFTVYYKYTDGTQAAPTHGPEYLTAGTYRRIVSPPITGFTPDIAVVEGNMPASAWTVTVIYSKDDNDDNPSPSKPKQPSKPNEPEGDDVPKDAGKEPVRNGNDAQEEGGANSGFKDGVEGNESSEEKDRQDNKKAKEEEAKRKAEEEAKRKAEEEAKKNAGANNAGNTGNTDVGKDVQVDENLSKQGEDASGKSTTVVDNKDGTQTQVVVDNTPAKDTVAGELPLPD